MTNQRRFFTRPRLWGLLGGLTLAVVQFFTPAGVGVAQAATTNCTPNGATQNCTVTFEYSGAAETWTAPAGVTAATFELYGAQGGNHGNILGGQGGRVTATLNVTSGAIYQILVGGAGSSGAGFNGGGSGNSSGGGGASDVRTGAFALGDRWLVAGGGGGGGGPFQGAGGAGGYPNGGAGGTSGFSGGGAGGTQTGGGAGGYDDGGDPGDAGALGQGGNSGSGTPYGGGGGGGYYGGGGGGVTFLDFVDGGGGGGGSSYGPVDATFANGVRTGDGLVIITYTQADITAPVIMPNVVGALGNNGWYISDVTVSWSVVDAESAISSQDGCQAQSVTSDTASVTFTCSASSAGGSGSESVTIKRDATAPVVTITGVSDGANYTVGSVPTAVCSTTDPLAAVATQATVSVTGGNGDGTGSYSATCSPATDNAGNSAAAVSVSYTVSAPADACTTTALRDNFNRANGGLGSNWAGLTGQSFYKLANQRVNVQLGGPVVWKPTTFGVNQAAFVTLSLLDPISPSQGVLLKVQSGTIPNAGSIAVVYDSHAKTVRVTTLRLNSLAWTTYGNTPATFANGDKLLGCVQADGTVRVYQNTTLLTTVTLNAADQSFFNAKGGKIGLWTVAAPSAFFDDFGGGTLTGVTGATLDATVPAEVADDGAEITVAVDFPTADMAVAPDAEAFVNRLFLPLVTR